MSRDIVTKDYWICPCGMDSRTASNSQKPKDSLFGNVNHARYSLDIHKSSQFCKRRIK